MKKWKKYKKYLQTGQWHIHTKYSDGKNTVDEICHEAQSLNIPLLAFTEHVRRNLSYNFEEFLQDIEQARKRFKKTVILSGCEAKVLPNGRLDAEKEVLRKVDIISMAFHSFPPSITTYLSALKTSLKNPNVDIWAHPGLFLRKNKLSLSRKEAREIVNICKENGVLIEINARYNLPMSQIYKSAIASKASICQGNDIHDITELK